MFDLRRGDCLKILPTLPVESVDSVVTDPPYALTNRVLDTSICPRCKWKGTNKNRYNKAGTLCPRCSELLIGERAYRGAGFMGKDWDNGTVAFNPATWAAVLRVAKPGAYLCAFGGTRTFHRLACAIEDGGWQIRDTLCWMYGQGFPKGKAALKPAWEPVILARKPGKRVEPLQIDACRVGTGGHLSWEKPRDMGFGGGTDNGHCKALSKTIGRWPANLLLSHAEGCRRVGVKRVKCSDPRRADGTINGSLGTNGIYGSANSEGMAKPNYADADGLETVEHWICDESCPVRLLDEQSGVSKSTGGQASLGAFRNGDIYGAGRDVREKRDPGLGDSGGASRFFTRFRYCPKASRRERGEGNCHPTVKPLAVIEWLIKLTTPGGGTVLDPFLGSGTTGLACANLGRNFIGIEKDPSYFKIARKRIKEACPQTEALAA